MARTLLGSPFAALLSLAACTPGAAGTTPPATTADTPATHCRYDVSMVDAERAVIEVHARCDGNQVSQFVAYEHDAWSELEAFASDGSRIEAADGRFRLPTDSATIRYRIDLTRVAQRAQSIDVCYQAGDAWVVAGSTFLMRPLPGAPDAAVTVHFGMPKSSYASALARAGDDHRLRVGEIGHSTYSVFGSFERRVLSLSGPMSRTTPSPDPSRRARLEVVTLPGPLRADRETRMRWIESAAGAVSDFWGGFPVSEAMMMVIPAPGHRDIAHGKVVATGGAGVAIHLGSRANRAALYRDWILVHELFHLGFPSFAGEGKWLDEGLATYYEPIIRTRAGWRDEHALWSEFAHDMDQGVTAVELGMEQEKSYAGMYWGGAIIALLADVEARKLSQGRLGLEDGLRAVLAQGGNATQVWTLERVIEVVDARLGAPVLERLRAAHRHAGTPVDLEQLFGKLGVRATERGVRFDEDAELADLRKHILAPPR